jgi:hypothetical protein
MNYTFPELLWHLKNTITESLGSDQIAAAIAALEEAGHQVVVSLDVAIKEGRQPGAQEPPPENSLRLSHGDKLFLQLLHISTEVGPGSGNVL